MDQVFRYRGLIKDIALSLHYVLYFSYLLVVLMLNSQMFLGKALIVTIRNNSLCLGQSVHIKFVIIPIQFASCWVLKRFQLVRLRLYQPLYWKHIFEQNLYIVRYVDCLHQMSLPTSSRVNDIISLITGLAAIKDGQPMAVAAFHTNTKDIAYTQKLMGKHWLS